MNTDALRSALERAKHEAPHLVDDERAERIARVCSMVEGSLERLASARTTERRTNRIPAALRVLARARSELQADTSAAWVEASMPAVAALERFAKRLEEAHTIAVEAEGRIDAVLSGSEAA